MADRRPDRRRPGIELRSVERSGARSMVRMGTLRLGGWSEAEQRWPQLRARRLCRPGWDSSVPVRTGKGGGAAARVFEDRFDGSDLVRRGAVTGAFGCPTLQRNMI